MAFPDYIKRGTVSLFLATVGGIMAITAGWYGLRSSVTNTKIELQHHIDAPMHNIAREKISELGEKLNRIETEQRVQGNDIDYIKKGIEQIQKDMRGR